LGVAIRRGDALSLAYLYTAESDRWGVGVFVIEAGDDGPTIAGEYTSHPGGGKLGREKWTFVGPPS
jgi:hypothetical protein